MCRCGFILDKFCVSFSRNRYMRKGIGAVVKVPWNEKMEVCHRTERLPSNLDLSLPLLHFSHFITSCFPVTSPVASEEASIEHCLCTTRPQWPPAAFHSPCALKSHHCHPLLGNLLPLYSSPFKLFGTTLQSHNTFSFFKSLHFFLKF